MNGAAIWFLLVVAVLQAGIAFAAGLRLRRASDRLDITTSRMRLLRWALIEITQKREDCGCSPCLGQCRSAEALAIENEGRIEIAIAALRVDDSMRPPRAPPLPDCERPVHHAGVNAGHRSFMDRLTCPCAGCVKWRDLTAPVGRA